jgi:hypothetical protein
MRCPDYPVLAIIQSATARSRRPQAPSQNPPSLGLPNRRMARAGSHKRKRMADARQIYRGSRDLFTHVGNREHRNDPKHTTGADRATNLGSTSPPLNGCSVASDPPTPTACLRSAKTQSLARTSPKFRPEEPLVCTGRLSHWSPVASYELSDRLFNVSHTERPSATTERSTRRHISMA